MASLGPGSHGTVPSYRHLPIVNTVQVKLGFLPVPFCNEAPVDAAVRELFEETGLTVTADDLTLLRGDLGRVPLPVGQYQLVHVFSASVHVPYVTSNKRTQAKVEQGVTAQSTVHPDSSYVVSTTVDFGGLTFTSSKIGLVNVSQRKFELLHFGYLAQWKCIRGAVISRQLFLHADSSLPKQLFFHLGFTAATCGHVWMLIKAYINKLCGELPNDLRMGVPAPTTNFVGLNVTLNETQRKAAIDVLYQSRQEPQKLEDWLEMQPHRYVILGINPDSYIAAVWVTSQFLGPLNSWWLNHKQQQAIPCTFDSLVTEICKTSMLPNIQDDAITTLIQHMQGSISCATYTQNFNDLLRRSRHPLTNDFQCIYFIRGMSNFHLHTHAKSHRSQQKGYCVPLVEFQKILNDLVNDSHDMGRAHGTHAPHDNLGSYCEIPVVGTIMDTSVRCTAGESWSY
jgi:hypothetical protein